MDADTWSSHLAEKSDYSCLAGYQQMKEFRVLTLPFPSPFMPTNYSQGKKTPKSTNIFLSTSHSTVAIIYMAKTGQKNSEWKTNFSQPRHFIPMNISYGKAYMTFVFTRFRFLISLPFISSGKCKYFLIKYLPLAKSIMCIY